QPVLPAERHRRLRPRLRERVQPRSPAAAEHHRHDPAAHRRHAGPLPVRPGGYRMSGRASRPAATALAIACAMPAATGCGALCDGPGCEDAYAAARLSVLRGPLGVDRGGGPELDVWADADARLDGTEEDGSAWSVA